MEPDHCLTLAQYALTRWTLLEVNMKESNKYLFLLLFMIQALQCYLHEPSQYEFGLYHNCYHISSNYYPQMHNFTSNRSPQPPTFAICSRSSETRGGKKITLNCAEINSHTAKWSRLGPKRYTQNLYTEGMHENRHRQKLSMEVTPFKRLQIDGDYALSTLRLSGWKCEQCIQTIYLTNFKFCFERVITEYKFK